MITRSSTFELVRITTAPPVAALPLSVTVPVEVPPLPPAIVAGLSVSEI